MILLDLWEWAINLFLLGCASVLLLISSFGFVMLINIIDDWRNKK